MLERTRLLIVDDLPEHLRALNALLRDDECAVFQAATGVAAGLELGLYISRQRADAHQGLT